MQHPTCSPVYTRTETWTKDGKSETEPEWKVATTTADTEKTDNTGHNKAASDLLKTDTTSQMRSSKTDWTARNLRNFTNLFEFFNEFSATIFETMKQRQ